MKQFINGLVCAVALCTTLAGAKVLPYISIRSQSENAARELVLWQTQINLSCMEDFYGSFSITPEYTRTFRQGKIARVLFHDALNNACCTSDCVTFKVQGSAVSDRDPKALLADYFGLPLDYSSVVQVSPRIENILADFNLYLGLDCWVQGLYFRIHAPVVHTRWDLGFCEKVAAVGEMNHPLGYFNSAINGDGAAATPFYGIARSDLVGTFEGFVSRCEVPSIEGITFNPLRKARFAKCRLDDTKLSDIQMALGWNFWQSECYHFGVNIRGAAPTGTRPEGSYLFEPIVGNGKHWELGAGITGHWRLWQSCDECQEFNVYLDANLTHLFEARQCRTFDLCGKPLSRYMLASKMTSDVEDLVYAEDSPPTYQFANEFTSVANLSTIKVDVSAAVQADIALKFAYSYNCFQFDLGYEFWGRSCEKICPRSCDTCKKDCCPRQPTSEIWALKGDSFVYGFVAEQPGQFRQPPTGEVIALSSSERDSQIFCGTNNYARADAFAWIQNAGVDNAKLAFEDARTQLVNWVGGLLTGEVNVYSSFDPYVFDTAQTKQWDFDNAQSRGMSHKLFANMGYIWKNDDCNNDNCCWQWTPYLGVGGEVEFGKVDKKCCCDVTTTCSTKIPLVVQNGTRHYRSCCCNNSSTSCCTTTRCCDTDKCCCTDAAISQWGVWIKGGISFN